VSRVSASANRTSRQVNCDAITERSGGEAAFHPLCDFVTPSTGTYSGATVVEWTAATKR
jgi:3-deoxy-D-manno-octulosonate 8-phosphate phosphatase KdsC-like HAD superfamily phosphatase